MNQQQKPSTLQTTFHDACQEAVAEFLAPDLARKCADRIMEKLTEGVSAWRSENGTTSEEPLPKERKGGMSSEGKANIALAQRARWAQARIESGQGTPDDRKVVLAWEKAKAAKEAATT